MKNYCLSLAIYIFIILFFCVAGCISTEKAAIEKTAPGEITASAPAQTPMIEETAKGAVSTVGQAAVEEMNLAPDFSLQDLNGNTFLLSNYRDKQPVLLFFWTTWCPFCSEEMKLIAKRSPQLLNDGLQLVGINVEESLNRVKGFVKSHNLPFLILLDKDAQVAQSFNIVGIPTYFLIDKKGVMRFTGYSFPEEYKSLLSEK